MTNLMNVPAWFRDEDWLLFSGNVTIRAPTQVTLVPHDALSDELIYAFQDILELADSSGTMQILVRRFAKLFNQAARKRADRGPKTPQRCSGKCGTGGCECTGNLEICCDSGTTVGSCYGSWSC